MGPCPQGSSASREKSGIVITQTYRITFPRNYAVDRTPSPMKPLILPPRLSGESKPETKPQRKLSGGQVVGIVFAVVVSLVAVNRSGHMSAFPLFLASTLLPLLWLNRLVNAVRHGVITNRIRTGSRTSGQFFFTLSGDPDIYHRQKMPFRFWMTWLAEGAFWIFITPFFWVIVFGTILEGSPK